MQHTTDAAIVSTVKQYAENAGFPETFATAFMTHYAPVLSPLAMLAKTRSYAPIIGVSGCQGSGKSTLSELFAQLFRTCFGLNCALLSLDDVYLTQQQRQSMATNVHPLFATRGVPGTHDIGLLTQVLDDLQQRTGTIRLPRFDKALDERTILAHWPQFSAPADIIILEGWCLGIPPQPIAALTDPINRLEAEHDAEGIWRQAVNTALTNAYQSLFKRLDVLLFLQAPSFDCVYAWRWQQELALIDQNTDATPPGVMSSEQVNHFILHFERLTRHALTSLPQTADGIWRLADDRRVKDVVIRGALA